MQQKTAQDPASILDRRDEMARAATKGFSASATTLPSIAIARAAGAITFSTKTR